MRGSYPLKPEPPRPHLLERALEEYRLGKVGEEGLERAFRRGMVEAIAEQVTAGLEMVGDGYVRWDGPIFYLTRRLKGFLTPEDLRCQRGGRGGKGLPVGERCRAIERVEWKGSILGEDFQFLSERSPVEVRMGITGPFSLARSVDPGIYGEEITLLTNDIARALNQELKELERRGAQWVMVEEPILRREIKDWEGFEEAARKLTQGVEMAVILGIEGPVVGLEALLSRTPFRGFAVNLQAYPENEVLLEKGDIWEGRVLELGLVDGDQARIESAMEVAMGLMKFARRHDPNLIWVSPASSLGTLTRDCAFVKLTHLVEGVRWARHQLGREQEGDVEEGGSHLR